jgi:hypothetical protein
MPEGSRLQQDEGIAGEENEPTGGACPTVRIGGKTEFRISFSSVSLCL